MTDRPITLTDRLEAWGARGLLGTFGAMRPERASAVGSALLRAIGPRLGAHRVAAANLRRAFPEKNEAEIAAILRGMWDNLGRTLGEMPHLDTITRLDGPYLTLEGADVVADLKAREGPILFFGGHIGNWEINPWAMATQGLPMHVFFRAPNNPLVEDLYARIRGGGGFGGLLPKGSAGARAAMATLKQGRSLGMLVDQKMNDGIPVPFFGREAMTAPALAQFALRFHAPVVPLYVRRLTGCRFRVILRPPLDLPATGDRHADIAETMRRVNAVLEDWIREAPEQWLWVHRRWPKAE